MLMYALVGYFLLYSLHLWSVVWPLILWDTVGLDVGTTTPNSIRRRTTDTRRLGKDGKVTLFGPQYYRQLTTATMRSLLHGI